MRRGGKIIEEAIRLICKHNIDHHRTSNINLRFERRVRVHQGSRVDLREQRIFPAKDTA